MNLIYRYMYANFCWLEKLHLYTTVVAVSTGLQLHVHVLTNVSDSPFSL